MKKLKLFTSLASLCLSLAVLCFGVFAALQVNYTLNGSVSYVVKDAFVEIETRVFSSATKVNDEDELHQLAYALSTDVATFPEDTTYAPEGYKAELLNKDVANVYNQKYTTATNSVNSTENVEVGLNLSFDTSSNPMKMVFFVVVQVTNIGQIDLYITTNQENFTTPENTIPYSSTSKKLDSVATEGGTTTQNYIFAIALDDVTKSIQTEEDNFNCPLVITTEKPSDVDPLIVFEGLKETITEYDETIEYKSTQNPTNEYAISSTETYVATVPSYSYSDGQLSSAQVKLDFTEAESGLSTYSNTTKDITLSVTTDYMGTTMNVTPEVFMLQDGSTQTMQEYVESVIQVYDSSDSLVSKTIELTYGNIDYMGQVSENVLTHITISVPSSLQDFYVVLNFQGETAQMFYEFQYSLNYQLMGAVVDFCISSSANLKVTAKNNGIIETELKTESSTGLMYTMHNLKLNNAQNYDTADLSFSMNADGTMTMENETYNFKNLNLFGAGGIEILNGVSEDNPTNLSNAVFILPGTYNNADGLLGDPAVFDKLIPYTVTLDEVKVMVNLSITVTDNLSEFTLFIAYNTEVVNQLMSMVVLDKLSIRLESNNDDIQALNITRIPLGTKVVDRVIQFGETSKTPLYVENKSYNDQNNSGGLFVNGGYYQIDMAIKNIPQDATGMILNINGGGDNYYSVWTDDGDYPKAMNMLSSEILYGMYVDLLGVSAVSGYTTSFGKIIGYGSGNSVQIDLSEKVGDTLKFTIFCNNMMTGTTAPLSLSFSPIIKELEKFKYTENTDGTYTISYGGFAKLEGELKIPSSYNGKAVTAIAEGGFALCNKITSVEIPDTITTIGSSAFTDCNNLKSVVLPSSITSIPSSMFSKCYSLTNITIPSNVSTIGNSAFYNCKSLTSITIPNKLTKIDYSAFSNSGITQVVFEDINNSLLTEIGDNAFSDTPLQSIDLQNIETIGYRAFAYTKLRDVVFTDQVALESIVFEGCVINLTLPSGFTIDSEAFRNCTLKNLSYTTSVEGEYTFENGKLTVLTDTISDKPSWYTSNLTHLITSIEFPTTLTRIGNYAFHNAKNLKTVILPEGLEYIGEYSFYGCDQIRTITIPNSVTYIGSSAFENCNNLIVVNNPNKISQTTTAFYNTNIIEEDLTYNEKYITFERDGDVYLAGFVNDSFTTINNDIPNNVTKIYKNAFKSNANLTSVVISSNITEIGEDAFCDCINLTDVTLNCNITELPDGVFSNCKNLVNITLPDTINKIGNTFANCSSLKYVAENGNEYIKTTTNNYYILTTFNDFSVDTINENCEFILASPSKSMYSIIIPAKVKNIFNFYTTNHLAEVYNYSKLNLQAGSSDYGHVALNAAVVRTDTGKSYLQVINNIIYCIFDDNFVAVCPVYSCQGFESFTLDERTTKINAHAFENSTITALNIPNSVTEIGNSAFSNSDLNSINIPGSVKIIGESAFSSCDSLTSVTLNEGLESIGSRAFEGCKFTEVTIPSTVKFIDIYALTTQSSSFNHLQNVYITDLEAWCKIQFSKDPNELNAFTANPISYAGNLYLNGELVTSVDFTNMGITKINAYAFYYCKSLQSVTIPANITEIGKYAFGNCTALQNVNITDLTAWCNIDFKGSPMVNSATLYLNGEVVTSVDLTNMGITKISSYAFYNFKNLKSVTIPATITEIGEDAFTNCEELEAVYITDLTAWCNIDMKGWRSNPLHYAKNLYVNNDLITTVDYTNMGLTEVKHYSFMGEQNITTVILPSTITSIGNYAFNNCVSLSTINLDSVKSIGNYTFTDCTSLSNVNLDCIESFGYSAFNGCILLNNITLPNSLKTIEQWTFANCDALESITIPASVETFKSYVFDGCDLLSSVTFLNELTNIPECTFSDCKSLNNFTIPATVKYINTSAFQNCDALESIIIPAGVKSLGNSAFNGCNLLSSVTLLCEINEIPRSAFNGCINLTSITIPASVVSLGEYAFSGCTTLGEVIFEGNNLTTIGAYAFEECEALTTIVLPQSVKTIGNYVFSGCTNLQSITIKENVTSMGNSCFKDCSSLSTVVFDGNLSSTCQLPSMMAFTAKDGTSTTTRNYIATGTAGQGTYTK